ncbi:MAG: PEP-CTERM sorting domain-containing protein [Opitutaceae bacterium]
MNKYLLPLLLPVAVATPAFAVVVLDFSADSGDFTNANFPSTESVIDYGLVGNDGMGNNIYARLTALNTYSSSGSGATSGDVRVNAAANNTAQLRLSLFEDASYLTEYDPGVAYSWTSTFADIEGSGGPNSIYESVTLKTPGSYEVANDTVLQISANGSNTTFSGQGAALYTNPSSDTLTPLQGQVAMAYTASNISSFDFNYRANGVSRNMFIDVGNLQFNEATTTGTYSVGAVPEPASAGLLLGASGIMMALLRRKQRRAL